MIGEFLLDLDPFVTLVPCQLNLPCKYSSIFLILLSNSSNYWFTCDFVFIFDIATMGYANIFKFFYFDFEDFVAFSIIFILLSLVDSTDNSIDLVISGVSYWGISSSIGVFKP